MKRLVRRTLTFIAVLIAAKIAIAASPFAPAIAPGRLSGEVNPFIGTGGLFFLCGNVSPAATMPFGMVRLGPDTISPAGRTALNSSGYYHPDERIVGFSHTRLSGTGAVDGGHFRVTPLLSPVTAEVRKRGLDAGFSHARESAFPGYYAVELSASKIVAELTATPRVGTHRYTFPAKQDRRLWLDVTSTLGKGRAKEGRLRLLPDAREIEGEARTFGSFSGRYGGLKAYFVARFSDRWTSSQSWSGRTSTTNTETLGDDIGVDLAFGEAAAASAVELRLAISYVSIANARANLDAEAPPQATFDQLFAQAKAGWEKVLGRIEVEGGTRRERTVFYTSLYHSLLMPTTFSDVNGDYLGFDGKVHRAQGFTYYTDMSLWDTFRTTHPLYTLVAPAEQRDMLVSLVEMAKQGGYLPRWPSGGGYTNSMFGTPADVVIAESWLKGIRDFDVETAYAAMRKTALAYPAPGAKFSGREGIDQYLKYRYCPAEKMGEAVARTMEYSWCDHAIAGLSAALGKQEDAAMFAEHSRYYRNLWNPETQFFQPRNSDGKFAPFRPELLTYLDRGGELTNDYVEGSALQWRWAAPFDAEGLISLFKSREYFVAELERFFEKSPPAVSLPPNAFYWHGNQPDLAAVFLFNAAGRPDLTQKWSRWILEHKYGDGPNGIDGNDDGGTLSAWYVLVSLGLYPIAGTDRYEITSPIWKRAMLKTGDRQVVITANGPAGNPYIRRVLLNDKPVAGHILMHADLVRGANVTFELGASTPR